ncbi:Trans-acting enoyl reductase [Pleurostoma richardsiae]|uniref:Trans-acting enoyl reductase n=1 Tax=Pleurostoma richardsiae TaxID=41990 RepID=A0AA38RHU0_9PEZI|nr:Trans-acting enoyl reductase [Pleurostoma richardsiae]
MPFKKHGRQYDIVLFGATGYTGKFAAEHITTHLPTDLKWAIAGRSRSKLEKVAAELQRLDPDRRQPDIEVCDLNSADLSSLAAKTFILMTTVGPYGMYGEHAFKACAERGTHYLDVTGEVPYVARMIKKYEVVARANGSLMFPQIGIESAPPDLITWLLASRLRADLSAKTRDVTVSIHRLNAAPSGGTLATVLSVFDVFSLQEFKACRRPFALSPILNLEPAVKKPSLLSRLTGLRTVPNLGLLTTSIAGATDAPIVQRTWGLLSAIPSRKSEFYGPNFSFEEYMKPRNWFQGIVMHWGLLFSAILLATVPPFRKLVRRFVYQPGEGKDPAEALKEDIEFRGVANPDLPDSVGKQAFCRAWYKGGMYYLTGVLLAQAASTILEEDLHLDGGVYTAACLGQPFIDRLDGAGFQFETKLVPV